MPADGISLPFTIGGNVGSSRPEEQLSCRDYKYPPPIQKATFCRTSASAECRHWSGRAVRWSICAILLSKRSSPMVSLSDTDLSAVMDAARPHPAAIP